MHLGLTFKKINFPDILKKTQKCYCKEYKGFSSDIRNANIFAEKTCYYLLFTFL